VNAAARGAARFTWSRMLPRHTLASAVLLAALAVAVAPAPHRQAAPDGPPYSPQDSMATMQLAPGFRLELVAHEPAVQSPVAMDIDEDGRMFVVEMPGYPLDTSPTGRVTLLEDTDGDGRMDRSRVFADGLVLPTGVMRWKKGVLVTAAPDLLYLEDSDGDGRADRRTVVVTGFAFTNPQHTVNSPVYGLDNWIYLAHEGPAEAIIYRDLFGDRGRPLSWPNRPGAPAVHPRNRSIRLRPDSGVLEPLAGSSQFGHGFDAFGRYLTNDNSSHARHEVIAARYLARTPQLLLASAMQELPDHGAAARIFPITKRPTFELLTEVGQFTSACAITPYTGGAFPAPDGDLLFVAEPVHNLVHRDVLSPAGATFTARRAEKGREFLAAGDSWFRPVNLYVGPDGALYVVDYYRARIEHPEWTATELHKDPQALYEGRERGRIYRIVADGAAPDRRTPSLGAAPLEILVGALADPNGWWRRTAQRLLVERSDRGAVRALADLAATSPSPLGRLHALWTLEGLGSLDTALVLRALDDPAAGVRENAIVLAETRLASAPALGARLLGLEQDPDARVRFQVLASLGFLDTPEVGAVQQRMLLAHIEDPWMQVAALSGSSDRALQYIDEVMAEGSPVTARASAGRTNWLRHVASVVGARQHAEEIQRVIDGVRTQAAPEAAWWRAAMLDGLLHGARGRITTLKTMGESREALVALQSDPSGEVRRAALALLRIAGRGDAAYWRRAVARALVDAKRPALEAAERADAVAFVALDRPERRIPWFQSLIAPQEAEPVQVEAVRALGRIDREDLERHSFALQERTPDAAARIARQISPEGIGRFLLARWPQFTPAIRREAADVLIGDEGRARLLLAAMRRGVVQSWTLDFWQKRNLVMHGNDAIRAGARTLLEENPRQRGRTVKRYAAALDLAGDALRGRQVFDRVCASCHAVGGAGNDLGPDLATVRHRPPLALLSDILLPSQSIAQRYETYIVERMDGGAEAGVLGGETSAAVTLRQGEGRQVTIPRSDIKSMRVLPQSSMPADLDRIITPEEMADLLAFIRNAPE
jgi:putative membrane-bound dehydrogenase-like protein